MKNTSIFLILALIISSCKNDCDDCNSDLITEFVIQKDDNVSNSFLINYDEEDRIISIFQEGFLQIGCGQNSRLFSENITYTYEDDKLRFAVADVIEIMGTDINGQRFEGRVYKSFLREGNKVYEIVDSVETIGSLIYSQDTTKHSLNGTLVSSIEEFKTGYVQDFIFNEDDNVTSVACFEKDDFGSPYVIGLQPHNYNKDENPFKIFNEKLGYLKFSDLQFTSAHVYRNAQYTGPSGPGQGPTITYSGEVKLDCHGSVIDVDGNYVIKSKLCR